MRIVSLLPSATEILFALGLGEQVAAVTFECDHPPEARTRHIVSTSALPEGLAPAEIDIVVKERMAAGEDLYRLDRGAFAELDPDLIVTQDLCAVCAVDISEVDAALTHLGCDAEVLTLDPMRLDEVIASITSVGEATGAREQAEELVASLRARLGDLDRRLDRASRRSTVVLEWTDPAFSAGHWVPDMVAAAGGIEVLGQAGKRSEGVGWDRVAGCGAEVVVVAPCGFGMEGAADLAAALCAAGYQPEGSEVWAVDADAYVVRPGPRVVDGCEMLATVLHPARVGAPDPTKALRIA